MRGNLSTMTLSVEIILPILAYLTSSTFTSGLLNGSKPSALLILNFRTWRTVGLPALHSQSNIAVLVPAKRTRAVS
jgi:hypothetical protein